MTGASINLVTFSEYQLGGVAKIILILLRLIVSKPRRFKMNISRFAKFTFLLAIVALIAGLSACEQLQQFLPPSEMDDLSGEIRIGVSLPLSGSSADDYGFEMQNGFELALEEINSSGRLGDQQIKFIEKDDEGTAVGILKAFDELIHQHEVSIITGITFSSQGKLAFPIAQQNEVVCFSSVASAAGQGALGDFIFRAGLTTNLMNPYGVGVTHEALEYENVATIFDERDTYSSVGHGDLIQALEARGVNILEQAGFTASETGETDFTDDLNRIMETNPDAIFISALAGEMTQILIQGQKLGITAPFIVPDMTSKEVQNARRAVEGAAEGAISFLSWISAADTPGNRDFLDKYVAMHDNEPGPWAAQSYATLYILTEAILNAGSTDSAAVRDALKSIMDFDTVLGPFSFDADGEAVYTPKIQKVVNGELQPF